ncbi:molecular chaperone Tir [Fulvivirga sp. RKSG066]|uniref:YbjN domain-containing protein n=1 Tax=Fulvivirga aurantia TaxID=2529383 RepID=UPI0012BB5184|nr:YbjN domain-containing protein [Fulvivirga aurantia]MTI21644.1 molecular chaperone Tir [Fulvivirga aurantia]
MSNSFQKVRNYLLDLDCNIRHESEEEGLFVVEDEKSGINNLVLGCADPILIIEQYIFEVKNQHSDVFMKLLQKNRDIIHGAFVLDESGTKVIFRNTLELENLDLNELEASFNSLSLLLSEYSNELIEFSKN